MFQGDILSENIDGCDVHTNKRQWIPPKCLLTGEDGQCIIYT